MVFFIKLQSKTIKTTTQEGEMPFIKGQSGNPRGRPRKNPINNALFCAAVSALEAAVLRGERWAIREVLDRKLQAVKLPPKDGEKLMILEGANDEQN